jgi:hypothetical protein
MLVYISVLNEKHLYVFLSDGWMCLRNIELECTWIHDCLGASNGMSMSKKVTTSRHEIEMRLEMVLRVLC